VAGAEASRITSAFGGRSTAREVVAGHDLTGTVAIVTGGATGIGIETARALAEAGAEAVLAVRNHEIGDTAAADINRTAKGPKARVAHLDLADLASVRAFAEAWGDRPLHLLINNAGVMACPLAYTADDLEMQFGTNHFGHYLLSILLAPALRKAADQTGKASRLVSLSSTAHRRSDVDFDDPHFRKRPYDRWISYGQSKTANALFAIGFHERFKDQGVSANSVMPGGILTPLQRHMTKEEMIELGWIDEAGNLKAQGFKTPEQGASTSVWAAIGPELEGVGGLYLENCAQAQPATPEKPLLGVHPWALNRESAERLWALSRQTTGAG
jgi:NAD(P)-dependent dehydrogenase (short-subunit alcohol dehydrogenase family)